MEVMKCIIKSFVMKSTGERVMVVEIKELVIKCKCYKYLERK
jgi:hypothetical protein